MSHPFNRTMMLALLLGLGIVVSPNVESSPAKEGELIGQEALDEFSISGCDALTQSLTCYLFQPKEITVAFHRPVNDIIQVAIDGKLVDNTRWQRIDASIRINIKDQDKQISIASKGQTLLTIQLSRKTPEFWHKLGDAFAANDLEKAKHWLAQQALSTNFERAWHAHQLARVYLREGKIDEALEQLDKAISQFTSLSMNDKVIDNLTVKFYLSLYIQDQFESAEKILHQTQLATFSAPAQFYRAFYQGQLADYVGDLNVAGSSLQKAIHLSRQHNLQRELRDALFQLSRVMLKSGEVKKSISIREDLIKGLISEGNPCRKISYQNGLAWALLFDEKRYGESIRILQGALADVKANCQHDESEQVNILLNLAKAHWLASNYGEARKIIDDVEETGYTFSYLQKLDYLDIKAKLAAEKKRYDMSLFYYQKLWIQANRVKYSEFLLSALIGTASAYEQLNEEQLALDYYETAEELILSQVLSIPAASLQPVFWERTTQFSEKYIALLLRNEQREKALNVARKFRGFWLNQMQEVNQLAIQQALTHPKWKAITSEIHRLRKSIIAQQGLEWQLPQDQVAEARKRISAMEEELSSLFFQAVQLIQSPFKQQLMARRDAGDGELLLFFYPYKEGWFLFAKHGDTIIANPMSEHSGTIQNTLEQWLIDNKALLDNVEHLRIYPSNDLSHFDFANLRLDNKPIGQSKSISFGVDVTLRAAESLSNKKLKDALVVANTLGDLKASEQEARVVKQHLDAKSMETHLLTNQTATIQRVKDALVQSDHFHYAGHIKKKTDQNTFEMPMADNTYIDTKDILLLGRAPHFVVLSACDSSSKSSLALSSLENIQRTESISLAQAFVLSGSEYVIATSRPVKDKEAEQLMSLFYQHWSQGKQFDQSFFTAQRYLLKEKPENDWLAFRLVSL